jgi:hypothetical protein
MRTPDSPRARFALSSVGVTNGHPVNEIRAGVTFAVLLKVLEGSHNR